MNGLRSLGRWDRLLCVCVVLCVGIGLATGWSLAQDVLPSVRKWLWNWRRGLGPEWAGRGIEKKIILSEVFSGPTNNNLLKSHSLMWYLNKAAVQPGKPIILKNLKLHNYIWNICIFNTEFHNFQGGNCSKCGLNDCDTVQSYRCTKAFREKNIAYIIRVEASRPRKQK
jgi:hypothetical protein